MRVDDVVLGSMLLYKACGSLMKKSRFKKRRKAVVAWECVIDVKLVYCVAEASKLLGELQLDPGPA